MKATGIVRNVDALGRVVIPKELRNNLGLSENEPLEIYVNGEQVILKKYAPGCVLCGGIEDVTPGPKGKLLCRGCRKEIIDHQVKF